MSQPEAIRVPTVALPPKKKKETLAIVALVLAALFFVPLAPLVGLILGIVALSTGRAKTISIIAVCIGAFFTMFVAVEVAIAIPAFVKYVRRAKSVEARTNVKILADAISALPAQEWASLPDSAWTPAESACAQPGHIYAPDENRWSAAPWSALGFHVVGTSRYQYRVQRDAQGFTVEAQGDLDCNGTLAHYLRHVTPEGAGPLTVDNDLQ